jgi:hypothetical protein
MLRDHGGRSGGDKTVSRLYLQYALDVDYPNKSFYPIVLACETHQQSLL